jgi:hypothetical protein
MEPIPSIREMRKEVPVALETVMKKMMAKKVTDRYQSMAEVIKALQTVDARCHLGAMADVTSLGDESLSAVAAGVESARGGGSRLSVRTQDHGHAGRGRKWLFVAAVCGALVLGLVAAQLVWKRQHTGGANGELAELGQTANGNLTNSPAVHSDTKDPEGASGGGGVPPSPSDNGAVAPEFVPPIPQVAPAGVERFGPFEDDLWDVTKGAEVTAHSPLGSRAEVPHDIRCLFGYQRPGKDGQLTLFEMASPGTVHFVEWRTREPITLRSFFLKASHDGERTRACRRFTLWAADPRTGKFSIKLFEVEPTIPYSDTPLPDTAVNGRQGPAVLAIRANVPPVTTDRFRAEFEQDDDGTSLPLGPKVMELDGFDEFCP